MQKVWIWLELPNSARVVRLPEMVDSACMHLTVINYSKFGRKNEVKVWTKWT